MLIQNVYEKQKVSSWKMLSLLKKALPLIFVSIFLSASVRADVVTYWNEVAANSIVRAGKSPGIHFAMVHAAIYDAVNSIDRFEAIQWFLSRGDECLNCDRQQDFWRQGGSAILRINKKR